MIEDAKLEENVTPAVRAMHTFPTYVSVQEAAMDYIESRIEVGEAPQRVAAACAPGTHRGASLTARHSCVRRQPARWTTSSPRRA